MASGGADSLLRRSPEGDIDDPLLVIEETGVVIRRGSFEIGL
ncbi:MULTISPECIES: hypothetical protein [Mesorhizobium]|nr:MULTISPECIES: hypothetical protein [Mesorhizobium]